MGYCVAKRPRRICNSIDVDCTHGVIRRQTPARSDECARGPYDAARSVLKLALGDEIQLSVESFRKLSRAFFDELREKFG